MRSYIVADTSDQAIGRIYAESMASAYQFLAHSRKYQEASFVFPASQRPIEDRKADLPLFFGEPPKNERKAGAKPSPGVRRDVKICGITPQMRAFLLKKKSRSTYLRRLINKDLAGDLGDFIDTTQYPRGNTVPATISGLLPGAARLLSAQSNRSHYLRRLVAWDMSQNSINID
jgi:hypothetical protein